MTGDTMNRDSTLPKIGFIGLGTMGKPMAINLARKGFSLMVRDINRVPVKELLSLGASEGHTPKEVAEHSTIVITMLFNDSVAKTVMLGKDGVLEGLQAGSLLVSMETISPSTAAVFAETAGDKGSDFIGAPVTGGPPAAQDGTLVIMAGGKNAVLQRCLCVLQAMGRVIHVGERPEMGQVFKLVNNFLSATNCAIVAEAMAFGVKAGADPEKLYEVISQGSGSSRKFEIEVPNMLEGSPKVLTLPIEGLFKDLELISAHAKEIRFPLLFPTLAQQIYLEAMSAGIGHKDPSAFAELYEKKFKILIRKGDPKSV